ncbi:MAG: hypothetical protein PHW02_02875 [bacterium]|nr:hypothetical protein [bacterium]
MVRFVFVVLISFLSLFAFSSTLTIVLEDSSFPCEVFLNDSSLGEIKDSLILERDSGTYRVSMFSKPVLDKDTLLDQSLLNDTEKSVTALEETKMQETLNAGTSILFLPKGESVRTVVKNNQVSKLIGTKSNGLKTLCCIGGAGGGCIVIGGVTLGAGVLALLGWGIYMLITEGLPDLD